MKDILDVLGVKKDGSYKKKLVYTFCKEYLLRWYLIFGIILFVFVHGISIDSPEYFVLIASFLIVVISFSSIHFYNKYDMVESTIALVIGLFLIFGFLDMFAIVLHIANNGPRVPKISMLYSIVLVAISSIPGSILFFKRLLELEKELIEHGKGKTRIINLYNFIGSAKRIGCRSLAKVDY